ncbi:MAG: hypothetical protein IPP64_05695 [Bacteroidetes bacterium]|nr:hypothetical protein [Bacteroidota bacterium]
MIRKDYIEKQVEQLALVIARIISEMTNAKTSGKIDSGISIADEFLKTEFDVEFAKLAVMDKQHLVNYLIKNKNIHIHKLDLLADVLFATAELHEKSEKNNIAKSLFEKTLVIYTFVNNEQKTFSQTRQEKISQINSKL